MPKQIKFMSTKGEVVLTEHSGAGNGYHLYIANFYQGQFVKRNDDWVWLNANTSLTEMEIEVIVEIIKKNV